MITRSISIELVQSAAEYPVVTILGPRQSGKTTLVQMTFPDKPYFTLLVFLKDVSKSMGEGRG